MRKGLSACERMHHHRIGGCNACSMVSGVSTAARVSPCCMSMMPKRMRCCRRRDGLPDELVGVDPHPAGQGLAAGRPLGRSRQPGNGITGRPPRCVPAEGNRLDDVSDTLPTTMQNRATTPSGAIRMQRHQSFCHCLAVQASAAGYGAPSCPRSSRRRRQRRRVACRSWRATCSPSPSTTAAASSWASGGQTLAAPSRC